MALIEGFRVQNYQTLRDVALRRLSHQRQGEALSPFSMVIGEIGAGESMLFDAFSFVGDCLARDVETACNKKQWGGFERLRYKSVDWSPLRKLLPRGAHISPYMDVRANPSPSF